MADATADEIVESLRRVSEDKYHVIRDAVRLWDELSYEDEAADANGRSSGPAG